MSEELAIFGGPKAVRSDQRDVFTWPVITKEDEEAVLAVLRRGAMSDMDVTREFEKEFAAWQGRKYALGFSTGTAAIQTAMWACKVGVGDEVIAPSVTYWATCLQALGLGATIVFAEVDADTLCIDPNDIEHRITDRTKAIIPVHYLGHPADMDPIMEIAEKHNIKVIEDVSHAQGGLYKGRMVGSIGHVGAMSLMSGKSLASGEGGMLVTDDREIYDRALAFGHYARFSPEAVETDYLKPLAGLPMGAAMNYFWDLLEGVPGLKAHRPPKDSGSNMGGWYAAHGLYRPEELEGLSVTRFCEAVRAEGGIATPGCNKPLHLHPLLNDVDIYGHGKPTPAFERRGYLRSWEADAHRPQRPRRSPEERQPAGEREDRLVDLRNSMVQEVLSGNHRGARQGVSQGRRELQGASRWRPGQSRVCRRVVFLS